MIREYDAGIIPVYNTGTAPHYLVLKHQAGHWGFPKGHIQPGETRRDAARRELREEAGIRQVVMIEGKSWDDLYRYKKADGTVVEKNVVLFLGQVSDEYVRPGQDEISDHAWLSYEAAHQRLTFASAREILRQANEFFIQLQNDG